MPRFKGLQGYLKGKGIECDYSIGNPGDFEVYAGDSLLFSKQSTGRYPSPPEVLAALQNLGM